MKTEEQKQAQRESRKKYMKTEKGKAAQRRAFKYFRNRLKIEILTHYGRGKLACVVCGESDKACLSIYNLKGGGAAHVKRLGGAVMFYPWLKRKGFPECYQTLCMNCQWKKRANDNRLS